MFDVLSEIPWLGTVVAVLAFAALGGLYFAVLVPRAYLSVMELTSAPKEQQAVPGLLGGLGPVIAIVVTVLTDAVLLTALDVTALGDAVVFGLLTGVGYLLTTLTNIAINPLFPHPLRYAALNAPFFVGGNTIAAVLVTAIG